MLAQGKTVGKAGEELFLSSKSVSTYRRRILDKMFLEDNEGLIRYALDHRLLD